MTILKSSILQFVVVAGLLIGGRNAVEAAPLTYSWSGTLRPHDGASPDPWGLGIAGAPFTMSTTVDAAAIDENPVQTPFADFAAISSRLWVNGEEIASIGAARIDFSDTADAADTIVMGGDFSKGGQAVSIFSLVGLSALTFSFSSPMETPPIFAATPVTGLSQDLSHPYIASVTQGTLVSVVPEPYAIVLSSLFGGVIAVRRRRGIEKRCGREVSGGALRLIPSVN